MHSSIIELSHKSVPASQRARAGHLPDWFYEQVCDYAENPGPVQREEMMEQFSAQLGDSCIRSGEQLTIFPQVREVYFRKSYSQFRAAAEALAQTDYAAFSGQRTDSALSSLLDKLNNSYENKRGVYIYLNESDELVALDRWLRTADFSKTFYIGGTVSYHC